MLKIIVAIILIVIMTLCEIGINYYYYEDKRVSFAFLCGMVACMVAIVVVSV